MSDNQIPEAATPEEMSRAARLWAALLDGEPAVDESAQITSADVNRQTAERMSKW